jgi:DNA-directed RNA polymerase subunit H (RpoH/RPB5)
MNKDEIIQDLKEKLEMEIQVKKNEVLINAEYKNVIEKLELQNETLIKINEDFTNKILYLKNQIKKLISN